MNLREAKRELIEHGYEIHQLNEGCYGSSSYGCGGYSSSWSNYRTHRAPYRKDSELSDEELQARNELRAKKAKNKEIKAKIEPIFQEYAKKLEKNYDVYASVTANKGTIIVELGDNLQIKMSKSLDNQTHFDLGTENGWHVSSNEILEFIERADEIKKLMADFKKFEIKI
ncbi:MAG: hypothetical protein MSH65_07525 [Spirochaetia bacterium]|nr:hypothetical protein [Spirochaetia bacterium]